MCVTLCSGSVLTVCDLSNGNVRYPMCLQEASVSMGQESL